jgi:type I restriction enzyme S subunit
VKILNEHPVLFLLSPDELATKPLRIDLNYYHPKYATIMKLLEKAAKHYDVKQLGEISEITRILGFETTQFVKYVDEGIPYLRVQNINEFEIDMKGVMRISKEAHEMLKRSQLLPNDVVMAITGYGKVGTTAVVPHAIGDCNASQEIARIRVQKEIVSPDYLAVYLNSGFGKKLLEKWNTGSTRPRTLIKNVRRIPVIIPTTEKQSQVVERVKALKQRKNKLLAEAECLARNAQEIQQAGYSCVYKILGIKQKFTKPEKVFVLAKKKLGDRMDVAFYSGSDKYTIQSEFPVQKMKDLVEFSKENVFPEREPLKKFKYVQIQDVDSESGKIASFTELLGKDAPSRARKVIHQGQILTGLSGSATGTSHHSTAVVTSELEGSIASTGFGVLKPREGVDLLFIYFMFRSNYVLDEIKRRLTGATIPAISESCFEQIEIPLPPIRVQCEIVDIFKKATENSENVKTQAKYLVKEAGELDQTAEKEFMKGLSIEKD